MVTNIIKNFPLKRQIYLILQTNSNLTKHLYYNEFNGQDQIQCCET